MNQHINDQDAKANHLLSQVVTALRKELITEAELGLFIASITGDSNQSTAKNYAGLNLAGIVGDLNIVHIEGVSEWLNEKSEAGKSRKQAKEIESLEGANYESLLTIGEVGVLIDSEGNQTSLSFKQDDIYVNRIGLERKVKEFISGGLEDSKHGKWLSIEADAGNGKSSLLWKICSDLKSSNEIFCLACQLYGEDTFKYANIILSQYDPGTILVLDTIDILIGDNNSRLLSLISDCRMKGIILLTTSRTQEILLLNISSSSSLVLGAFSPEESKDAIRKYVNRCYDEKTDEDKASQEEDVWNLLESRVRINELTLKPLILSMIFQSYFPSSIPRELNTQKVYDNYLDKIVCGDHSIPNKGREEFVAARLSYSSLVARQIFYSDDKGERDSVLKSVIANRYIKEEYPLNPHEVCASLISSGVLKDVNLRNSIRFFHQTFLEYMAAFYAIGLSKNNFSVLVSELLFEVDSQKYLRLPVLKQIAIQSYARGDVERWSSVIESLVSLNRNIGFRSALEIGGKTEINSGLLSLLRKTMKEYPKKYVEEVIDVVGHFPGSRLESGLELLDICLDTHATRKVLDRISKLNRVDPVIILTYIERCIANNLSVITSHFYDIRDIVLNCLSHGVFDAVRVLIRLYSSQSRQFEEKFFIQIFELMSEENASALIPLVEEGSKVLCGDNTKAIYAWGSFCRALFKFEPKEVEAFARSLYEEPSCWDQSVDSAISLGGLLGLSCTVDETEKFIESLSSAEHSLRHLSRGALMHIHGVDKSVLLGLLTKARYVDEFQLGMIWDLAQIHGESVPGELFVFFNDQVWPSQQSRSTVLKNVVLLSGKGREKELKKKYIKKLVDRAKEVEKPKDVRLVQLINVCFALLELDSSVFSDEDFSVLYELSETAGHATLLCSYIGVVANQNLVLARRLLLSSFDSPKTELHRTAISSLKFCVEAQTAFVISVWQELSVSHHGKLNDELLVNYCSLFRGFDTNAGQEVIVHIAEILDEDVLSRLPPPSLTTILTTLKTIAKYKPMLALRITARCSKDDLAVVGAISACHNNILKVSKTDKVVNEVLRQLAQYIKMPSSQRRFRHALRNLLETISSTQGIDSVFQIVLGGIRDNPNHQNIKDIVMAGSLCSAWRKEYSLTLLKLDGLPNSAKAILHSTLEE